MNNLFSHKKYNTNIEYVTFNLKKEQIIGAAENIKIKIRKEDSNNFNILNGRACPIISGENDYVSAMNFLNNEQRTFNNYLLFIYTDENGDTYETVCFVKKIKKEVLNIKTGLRFFDLEVICTYDLEKNTILLNNKNLDTNKLIEDYSEFTKFKNINNLIINNIENNNNSLKNSPNLTKNTFFPFIITISGKKKWFIPNLLNVNDYYLFDYETEYPIFNIVFSDFLHANKSSSFIVINKENIISTYNFYDNSKIEYSVKNINFDDIELEIELKNFVYKEEEKNLLNILFLDMYTIDKKETDIFYKESKLEKKYKENIFISNKYELNSEEKKIFLSEVSYFNITDIEKDNKTDVKNENNKILLFFKRYVRKPLNKITFKLKTKLSKNENKRFFSVNLEKFEDYEILLTDDIDYYIKVLKSFPFNINLLQSEKYFYLKDNYLFVLNNWSFLSKNKFILNIKEKEKVSEIFYIDYKKNVIMIKTNYNNLYLYNLNNDILELIEENNDFFYSTLFFKEDGSNDLRLINEFNVYSIFNNVSILLTSKNIFIFENNNELHEKINKKENSFFFSKNKIENGIFYISLYFRIINDEIKISKKLKKNNQTEIKIFFKLDEIINFVNEGFIENQKVLQMKSFYSIQLHHHQLVKEKMRTNYLEMKGVKIYSKDLIMLLLNNFGNTISLPSLISFEKKEIKIFENKNSLFLDVTKNGFTQLIFISKDTGKIFSIEEEENQGRNIIDIVNYFYSLKREEYKIDLLKDLDITIFHNDKKTLFLSNLNENEDINFIDYKTKFNYFELKFKESNSNRLILKDNENKEFEIVFKDKDNFHIFNDNISIKNKENRTITLNF